MFPRTLALMLLLFPVALSSLNDITKKKLVNSAIQAREKSYSPYSKYQVGAAILTRSGEVYTGTNIENASYGLTMCAERSGVYSAVSQGNKELDAIAIVTSNGGKPCGACLQVLSEFNKDIDIIIADNSGDVVQEMKLQDLLPQGYDAKMLQG